MKINGIPIFKWSTLSQRELSTRLRAACRDANASGISEIRAIIFSPDGTIRALSSEEHEAQTTPAPVFSLTAVNCIYFISAPALAAIKIGYTSRLFARLRSLQTGCPHRLEILGAAPGSPKLERSVHAAFPKRMAGEWFEATPRLLRFIDRINSGMNIKTALASYG